MSEPLPLRRNRDFVLLQAGQALSTVGSESSALAYPLLVLAVTGSPTKAGVVGFARVLPYALLALPAGVAADRWNRKRLMLLADGVRVLALGSLVAAIALDRLAFVQVPIVAFVEGAAYVLFNLAETGALRSVVPARQLPDAAAAEQARISAVVVTGPPLGGALFGLGRALPFAVDVASYAFSIATLLAMRTPFQEERERTTDRLRTQIAEGLRWLWGQRFLRASALLFAASNFAFEGLFLTLIVVARRHGLSGGAVGGLIAILGACALAGALAAPRILRRVSMRAIVLANLWLVLAVVAFVAEPNPFVLLAAVLPAEFCVPILNAAVIGYRIAVVPDRLVGRVNSVARNLALVAQPLGPLAAGVLLGAVSARATVGVFFTVMLGVAVCGTLSPSIRHAPSLSELDELPAATPSASPGAAG